MDNRRRWAFLFPGQGAQYPGMGKDFAESFAVARETFEEADEILGRPLSRLIFQGTEEELTKTHNSQPAIYVVSLAIWRVIAHQFPTLVPTVCSGLSLGEYSALTVAHRLTFEQCLPLVQARAQYMSDSCEQIPGQMAAIIGLDEGIVVQMVKDLGLPNDLWVANLNCPKQLVLSGTPKGIEVGIAAAKNLGAKRAIALQVHGAFHSGLMAEAEKRLAEDLAFAPIKSNGVAMVMNATGTFIDDSEETRNLLAKQVTHPVLWEKGIRAIEAFGVDGYLEIGCGKTLSGLNRRIGVTAPTHNVETVADLDQLAGVEHAVLA